MMVMIKPKKKFLTSDELEVKFTDTTNRIKQVLCSSSVDVVSVVEQLQLCSAVKDKNVPLFDDDDLKNVNTIENLWQKLNRFWSIFDYDVLRILLGFVKCKRADEIFEEFLSTTDISAIEDLTDLVLHYKVFEGQGPIKPLLMVKSKVENHTHSIRRKIEKVICSKFDLQEHSFRFKGIKSSKGCIGLVYEISNTMMSYILRCKIAGYDLAEFAANNIISCHINNMELAIPSEITMVCTYSYSYLYNIIRLWIVCALLGVSIFGQSLVSASYLLHNYAS